MSIVNNKIKKTAKLWAIIPAADSGQRFSSTILKQYQYIGKRTVLQHSVEALYQLPLAGCMIAVSTQDEIARNLDFLQDANVQFCFGGKERMDSVLAGLYALEHQVDPDDYILVHDAARPCLHFEQIQQILTFCQKNGDAAIVAVPVRDTLKKSISNELSDDIILHTVSRESLWQAQTPQIMRYDILKMALEDAQKNQVIVTDEASALERLGYSVQLIMGRIDNLKITYPEDLQLARLILQCRQAIDERLDNKN